MNAYNSIIPVKFLPFQRVIIFSLLLTSKQLFANCPTWVSTDRYIKNGAEVTDRRTGLIWARCSVGQTFINDTCQGAATLFTHEEALKYAAGQRGAYLWRLPNVKELTTILDAGCKLPAIDLSTFPGTLSNLYWSSTPVAWASSLAWVVSFDFGGAVGVASRSASGGGAIRLVR